MENNKKLLRADNKNSNVEKDFADIKPSNTADVEKDFADTKPPVTVRVSELLSKRLVCLNSAEIVGTISNIIFDNKLSYGRLLKIYNDDDDNVETSYVELKRVKNLEHDAAVVTSLSYISSAWEVSSSGLTNPINRECFNQDGKSLGIVKDIILDGVKVHSIVVGETDFEPTQILNSSESLLIFNDTGLPLKLPKPKAVKVPKPDKAPLPGTVKIHSGAPVKTQTPLAFSHAENQSVVLPLTISAALPASDPQIAQGITLPYSIPQDKTVVTRTPATDPSPLSHYGFLLNKILSKDIKNNLGEIIIAQNTIITEEIIALAKEHTRLVQLALYAQA